MWDGDTDPIVTDERGWPMMSGIHDARLTVLSFEFGGKLSFSADGAEGERTTFVLDDVSMLNIQSLWEGVIVDSVAVWLVVGDSMDDPEGDCGVAWRALLEGRVHPGDEGPAIARAKSKHDGFSLVSVSSSYGGELHVLCREMTINGRKVATA